MPKIKNGGLMKKQSRLQFTEEERADPTLEKSIAKSEKVADKLAQAKIPKKTVKTKERTFDTEQGNQRCVCILKKWINQSHPQNLRIALKKPRKEPFYLQSIRKSVKMSRTMWGLKRHTVQKRQENLRYAVFKVPTIPTS